MFKTLKDSRRRFVESFLEGVGATERTKDEEFNAAMDRFETLEKDLKQCYNMLLKTSEYHEKYFDFLSSNVSFFAKMDIQEENRFPLTEPFRSRNGHAIVKAHESFDSRITQVYRRSMTHLQATMVTDKMKDFLNVTVPLIYDHYEKRSKILIDYDSYRRRLKALREKKASLEAAGKGNSSAAQDNLADIGKFESKEKNMKEALDIKTQTILDEIAKAKEFYEECLQTAMVTSLTTQCETFRRTATELENVLSFFPHENVMTVRENFDVLVSQNGPTVTVKKEVKTGFFGRGSTETPEEKEKKKEEERKRKEEEKAKKEEEKAKKAGAVSASSRSDDAQEKVNAYNQEQNSYSPYSPPEPRPSQSLPVATPVSTSTTSGSAFSSSPVPSPVESSAPSAPPVFEPPSAPAPEKQILRLVRALYDHIADEEDELSFSVGDIVQVIEFSDDGWWTGEVDGRRGLFPVNYVEVLE